MSSKFKRFSYPACASVLVVTAVALAAYDLSDGHVGTGFRVAMLLSCPISALLVLTWLQWNLPALTTAFRAGVIVASAEPAIVPAPRIPAVVVGALVD